MHRRRSRLFPIIMHMNLFFVIILCGISLTAGESEVNLTIIKCCDSLSHYDIKLKKCSPNQNSGKVENLFSEETHELLERLTGNSSSLKIIPRNEDLKCPSGTLKRIVIHGSNASENAFVIEDRELLWKNQTYPIDEICLERDTQNLVNIFYCEETESHDSRNAIVFPFPLKTCCRARESVMWNGDSFSCIPSSEENSNHTVYQSIEDRSYSTQAYNFSSDVYYGFPNCSFKMLNNSLDTWFVITEDGSIKVGLKFWFRPVWLKVYPNSYCIDDVVISSFNSAYIEDIRLMHKNEILFYCELERFDEYLFHRRLFGGLCVTSSLIILCLLLIYGSVWEKQNMAAWTQFNLFASLFIVFGIEGVRVLIQPNGLDAKQTTSCFVVAAVAQYFFFTLNTTWTVMCFDLFWTFWRLESSDVPATKHPRRICAYFIVSWIIPSVVAVCAFATVYIKRINSNISEMGTLTWGHRRCSSAIRELGFTTQGIFFLVNLCFFLCTAIFIWKHQRSMKSAKRASTIKTDKTNWASVKLFLKLLIVMGVTSLSLPLDYFFGSHDPLSFFATSIRVTHFLPSLFAFYIFGFNQKNVKLLRKKYPAFKRMWDSISCNKDNLATSVGTGPGNPTPSGGTR